MKTVLGCSGPEAIRRLALCGIFLSKDAVFEEATIDLIATLAEQTTQLQKQVAQLQSALTSKESDNEQ